mmetsp:Transcript_35296/g.54044  ORF Transcript_35296/g.54044 Transcript_35296/m.54044 type:complete len:85 (-) Transcript_35296:195-449(-)
MEPELVKSARSNSPTSLRYRGSASERTIGKFKFKSFRRSEVQQKEKESEPTIESSKETKLSRHVLFYPHKRDANHFKVGSMELD